MPRSRTFYIQAKDTADNLLKSNQEVFQVTLNGPVTFTVVSAPVNPDAMDGLYQVECPNNRKGGTTDRKQTRGTCGFVNFWVVDIPGDNSVANEDLGWEISGT